MTADSQKERSFARSLASMAELVRFVDDYSVERVPAEQVPIVQLVVEEIFTNMVRHNADGADDIAVRLARNEGDLTITIVDLDSPRFDIREQGNVDINAPLKDRKPGGLGIHLVKHLVDEIHYHYKNGESTVTLIKKLEPLHA